MQRHAISCGLALALFLALAGGSPRSGADAHEADGHPARIQKGSCDALDGVAFALTGVGATVNPEGTPIADPEATGSSDVDPIAIGETVLDTSLTDLVDAASAIVVYESDEAMDHIIACGNIGGPLTAQMAGMVMPGDELAIWLAETGDSGFSGLALLEANGQESSLRIFLVQTGGGGEHGHDEGGEPTVATPDAG